MSNRIDIEDVQKHINLRKKWNSLDLEDIAFYHKGEQVEVLMADLLNWSFMGLSNVDFIGEHFNLTPEDIEQ